MWRSVFKGRTYSQFCDMVKQMYPFISQPTTLILSHCLTPGPVWTTQTKLGHLLQMVTPSLKARLCQRRPHQKCPVGLQQQVKKYSPLSSVRIRNLPAQNRVKRLPNCCQICFLVVPVMPKVIKPSHPFGPVESQKIPAIPNLLTS